MFVLLLPLTALFVVALGRAPVIVRIWFAVWLAMGFAQAARFRRVGVLLDGETLAIRNLRQTRRLRCETVRRVDFAEQGWPRRRAIVTIMNGHALIPIDATSCAPVGRRSSPANLNWVMSRDETQAAAARIGELVASVNRSDAVTQ